MAQVSGLGRATGHRVVQAALFSRAGVRAPQRQILEVARRHDPAAMQARQERLLPRREYNVEQPMVVWHIDCECSPHLWHAPPAEPALSSACVHGVLLTKVSSCSDGKAQDVWLLRACRD